MNSECKYIQYHYYYQTIFRNSRIKNKHEIIHHYKVGNLVSKMFMKSELEDQNLFKLLFFGYNQTVLFREPNEIMNNRIR